MSSLQKNPPSDSRTTWLRGVKRLVVKVGTSSLTAGTQALHDERLIHLAEQMVALRSRGIQTLLVTSGAIGVGMGRLGLKQRPSDIGSLQATAAVGQNLLMHAYETIFRRLNQPVGQILITAGDLTDRKRYVNFSNALASLFRYGVIPIINENDTVAVEEIRFGDNDTLSAQVANASDADLLVLLSDIDGVFTADPNEFPNASLIPVISSISPELKTLAEERRRCGSETRPTSLGTGRLATKIKAAEIVTTSGTPMVLANGSRMNVLTDILNGEEVGTFFMPQAVRLCRRKRWIAHTLTPRGTLTLDAGAKDALVRRGKSLLPSGITAVTGQFGFGDPVSCVDAEGVEVARGLVNYAAAELELIRGKRTDAIATVLGYRYADEAIHRDNLVVLENEAGSSVSQ